MYDANGLLEWHKQKFPLATVESQLLHLKQEINEFNEAVGADKDRELVDIAIIGLSFLRFINREKLGEKLTELYGREYFWNGEDYDRVR